MTMRNAFENLSVESKQDDQITALGDILTALNDLDANTDDLEALIADVITALGSIDVNTDDIETKLDTINTSVIALGLPLTNAQLRATPVPVSGTVTANAGTGPWPVTDNGGSLTVDGSVAVSNFPATQPVSAAALPLPTGAATAAKQPALGTAGTPSADVISVQGEASMTPIKTDGSATTQPVSIAAEVEVKNDSGSPLSVSGTVTANVGTTNGLALDATLTGGTQRSKITDGTSNAAVKAASTAAVATDPALVVAISPNNTVQVSGNVTVSDGAGPLTVDGTVNIGTTPGLTDTQLRASSVPVTDAALGALVKNEDAVAASGDPGIQILGVRNDSASAKTSTDGDYSTISVDSAGRVGITGLGSALNVSESPASAFPGSGRQAVTASAVALGSLAALRAVNIKAMSTNAASVFVGTSGVTTATGYELAAGDSITLPITNANLAFVIAVATGSSVCYAAV